MGFASGSLTFRRFAVIGKHPSVIDQELLDKLSESALRPGEFGIPEEVEYGWSGGRHILDAQFSFEHNVFADALHFALRIDTNKAPSDLKKAYTLMEEEALAASNPSGFISKEQKRTVKETVRNKIEDELRSGKFRRSKLLPILWDIPAQTLYCSVGGANAEKLVEIFQRTFDLELQPLTAGSIALRIMEPIGKQRDYEDLRPTRFVHGPDGEGQYPDYPWVAKGPEPKDFLGNEFLLWLWHEADHRKGAVAVAGDEVDVMIDRALDLDCAYGETGKDTLRGSGPSHMPEAKDALRSGKLPRKAGLTLVAGKLQYDLTFNPEAFFVASAKLPDVEEAETARELFEERIALLRDLGKALDALFAAFLKRRASSAWEGEVGHIRKWIMSNVKAVSAVA